IRFRIRPPVGAGFGRFAFAFRPFRLYQIFFRFRPLSDWFEFRSELPAEGACLSAFPTLPEEDRPE
ncbi:hypothetical protein ACIQU6_37475, partial [Streptomyces sp. NPDC090442]|uniref:hypothetical protein n=1 Tax=Streptomyces sp. NPDC090442 TaxID=3365962 RepID=UPI0037F2D114